MVRTAKRRPAADLDPRPEPPPIEEEFPANQNVEDAPARDSVGPLIEREELKLPRPEWASIWMDREYPPPEWLVPGVIPKDTIGAIVAPSHTGKTAFAVAMAAQAIRRKQTVAYVMEESTAHDFRARLWAAGVTGEEMSRLLVFFQLGVRLDREDWVRHLCGELRRADSRLCFFDTWSDVVELNQLDQERVLPVLKALRASRIETGCTMVPVMHTPKAVFSGETAPSLADIFGTVSTANILDFVHMLRPLKLKAKKSEDDDEEPQPSGMVEIHCLKLRSAGSGKPDPRVGKLTPVPLPSGRGTTVRFEWMGDVTPGQVRADLRLAVVEQKILRHVETTDCISANEVFKTMGGSRNDVMGAVKRMQADGRLTRDATLKLRPAGGTGGAA
jgi:hypothetical protein